MLVGFGAAGGLVVGGFAGRFTDRNLDGDNWEYRVLAYTLVLGLGVGGLLGAVSAWLVGGSVTTGVVTGGATGGVFSVLMSAILISAGRKQSQSTGSIR